MNRPRRIAIALLLFAVLTSGGLIGLAVADDDGPPAAASFTFAAPHEGDRGVYEIDGTDAWMMGQTDREDGTLSFELRGRSALVDDHGRPHVVDEFAYQDSRIAAREFWGAPGRTAIIVDALDHGPVAHVDEWNHEDEDDADDVGLARTITFLQPGRYADELPCGLHIPLQGQELLAGARVPAGSCLGHRQHPDGTSWLQVDVVGADGNASLVSLWTEGPSRSGKVADLSYTAGVPYPVTVDLYDRGEHIGNLQLTAFDAGDEALGMPPLPAPVELEWASRTPWMFDETGIEHPFPLSEAVTYAQNDPNSDLGAWLDEHKDAYIVDVSYWDFESSSGDRIEWRVAFREQKELYHLHIGKRATVSHDDGGDLVEELLGTGQEVPSTYYYFDASKRDVSSYGQWWPAPEELPTVASLWAFYDAWARPALREAGPNMYEIWIHGGEDGNRVSVEAGRFRDYPEGRDDPQITYSRDWAFVEMEVGQGDTPYRFSDRGSDKPAVHPGPSGPVDTMPLAGIQQASLIPVDPARAAGIGLAAAVVSVLYYLWPLGKTGAVGLFSRVRRDEVLDNPTRRRIHDYVLANPGCHYHAIVRDNRVSKGTAQHHLSKLESSGHVVSARSGGYRCFFVRGQVDRRAMAAEGVLKSGVARSILAMCQAQPGIRNGELAAALGVAPATVSYHIRRLHGAGLLQGNGQGHTTTDVGQAVASSS